MKMMCHNLTWDISKAGSYNDMSGWQEQGEAKQ